MAFFSEAVIDPETNELVKNQPFSILNVSDGSEATIYTYDLTGADGYTEIPQPVLSDENGMLSFWADPGYYHIDSGGSPTLVYLNGVQISDSELTTVFLSNTSTSFDTEQNYVTFNHCVNPLTILGGSETLSTFPSPGSFVYGGASDITLTFPAVCAPNAQFVLYQLGTGKITVGYTAPATRSNYSSHTKTAGPKAVVLVTNVGSEFDAPEYVLSGNTAA